MLPKQFGQRLKFLRAVKNLTQAALAELVGVTVQYIGNIERGLASPSFGVLEGLAQALQVEPASLFLFSPQETPAPQSEPPQDESRRQGLEWEKFLPWSGCWKYDLASKTLHWSDGLFQLLGYPPGSLAPTWDLVYNHVHEKDRDHLRHLGRQLRQGLSLEGFTVRFQRKDGEVRLAMSHAQAISDQQGKVVETYGLAMDVTEWRRLGDSVLRTRDQMEEHVRLRTSELRQTVKEKEREIKARQEAERELLIYRRIVDSSREGLAFLGPDYTYLAANLPYRELAYPDQDGPLVGQRAPDLAGREAFHKLYKPLIDKALAKTPAEVQTWVHSTWRGRRYLEISYVPCRDSSGQVLGVAETRYDLTREKEVQRLLTLSEQRFRGIFNQARVPAVVTDRGGRFRDVNDAFIRMVNYDRDELWRLSLLDLVPSARRGTAQKMLQKLAEGRLRPRPFTADLLRKDGGLVRTDIHLSPLLDDDGQLLGIIGIGLDLTERAQLRHRLREGRRRYQELFEAVTDAVFVHKISTDGSMGRFLEVNRAACRSLGFRREELLAMSPPDLGLAQNTRQSQELLGQVLAGAEVTFRQKLASGDGAAIPFEVHSKAIILEGERVVISVCRDLRRRLEAEEALAESERKYRAVVEGTDDLISLVDREGRFLFVNHRARDILGANPQDCQGRSLLDFVDPTDQARTKSWFQALVRDRRLKGSCVSRLRGRHGRARDMHWSVNLELDRAGEVKQVFGVARDVGASLQAERLLKWELRLNQALTELSQLLLQKECALPDFSRRVVASARELTGAQAANVCFFQSRDGRPRYPAEAEEAPLLRWVAGRRAPGNGPTGAGEGGCFFGNLPEEIVGWGFSLDGRPPANLAGAWVTCLGERVGWLAAAQAAHGMGAREALTLKRLAEVYALAVERERARERAEILQARILDQTKMEALGNLAGGLAHEFNNLLAVVCGYAELGGAELPPEHPVRDYLDKQICAALRGRDLVRRILKFARRMQPTLEPVPLEPTVRRMLAQTRESRPLQMIETRLSTSEGGLTALADPAHTEVILAELLQNAREAMQGPNGLVEVGLRGVDLAGEQAEALSLRPGHYVEISVRDNGVGMSVQVRDRAFEPFFTTKDMAPGRGMGLAVVHGIVHTLQGAISLQSNRGEGACFKVYLPAIE